MQEIWNTISDKVWYGFYFLYLIKELQEEKTNMEWHFYNFAKLFPKDINTDIIYWDSTNWESQTFCIDVQFYFGVSLPTCSYCKLFYFNVNVWQHIGTCRGSFRFLRVPVSQNDCFMKVKLSAFGVYWISVVPSHPLCVQSVQDLITRCENFGDIFTLL